MATRAAAARALVTAILRRGITAGRFAARDAPLGEAGARAGDTDSTDRTDENGSLRRPGRALAQRANEEGERPLGTPSSLKPFPLIPQVTARPTPPREEPSAPPSYPYNPSG